MLGESYKSVRHRVEQECALDASQQEDGDGDGGRGAASRQGVHSEKSFLTSTQDTYKTDTFRAFLSSV